MNLSYVHDLDDILSPIFNSFTARFFDQATEPGILLGDASPSAHPLQDLPDLRPIVSPYLFHYFFFDSLICSAGDGDWVECSR